MIRKLRIRLAALVVAVVGMGALAGCTFLFSWVDNPPYARVADASGNVVAGAVVTLTGATTFTDTTDSAGVATFPSFSSANMGTYTLSASLAGYVFYPVSVTIGENSVYVGTLIAYVTTATVTGAVNDARLSTGAGIGSVAVELFASGGTAALATTSTATDGAFSFGAVAPGSYTLSATKTGYAFIDRAFDLTQVGGSVDIGSVLGFQSSTSDISIIAVWSKNWRDPVATAYYSDVDTYLTYPTGDRWSPSSTPPDLTGKDPYTGEEDTAGVGYYADPGFLPDGSAYREAVYYGDRTSTATVGQFTGVTADTTPAITLDRDERIGEGPETITIKAPPVPAAVGNGFTTLGDATNGLPHDTEATNEYAWLGVMEYYVDAFLPADLSTEGDSGGAQVVVFVIQGSDVKGRFVMPDYMTIKQASVVRINMFLREDEVAVYQFLPDIRLASAFRSVTAAADAPLVLLGAQR